MNDFMDELLVKFDQNVRFPLRVKYLRFKNKTIRYIHEHPIINEYIYFIILFIMTMLLSYMFNVFN